MFIGLCQGLFKAKYSHWVNLRVKSAKREKQNAYEQKEKTDVWKGIFYCDKQPFVITGCKRKLESSSSRWRRGRILSSPPPTDALNLQLHMEHSPLKETQKLAE